MRFFTVVFGFLIFVFSSSVFSIEDITTNNVVINSTTPFSAAMVKKLKGVAVCEFKGTSVSSGSDVTTYQSGYSIMNHLGQKLSTDNFGSYTNTASAVSMLHLNIAIPGSGAVTYLYTLDTTASKYVVNNLGVGLAELHWNCLANQSGCTNFVDQMGFTMKDTSGKTVITSHINGDESTYLSEQNVLCTRR